MNPAVAEALCPFGTVQIFKLYHTFVIITDNSKHVITHTQVLDEYLSDYTNLWVDIDLYINECRAKFINGEMDIETEFDDYLATLKSMGMDKIVEYKQATLDAYNAR